MSKKNFDNVIYISKIQLICLNIRIIDKNMFYSINEGVEG